VTRQVSSSRRLSSRCEVIKASIVIKLSSVIKPVLVLKEFRAKKTLDHNINNFRGYAAHHHRSGGAL
jgi:hypothetical protein